MYLNIDDVKRHLIIDHNLDDLYLADLITVAEDAVRTELNVDSLCEFEDCRGMLPACIYQAMLLMIGQLYANREPVSYGSPKEVPLSYRYLLDLKRRYK